MKYSELRIKIFHPNLQTYKPFNLVSIMDGTTRETIHVGVYLPSGSQLLDAACVDIIATLSRQYMKAMTGLIPEPLIDVAPVVRIYWIGAPQSSTIYYQDGRDNADNEFKPSAPGLARMTAQLELRTTHDISSPEVQPGKLDALLVPGPNPKFGWKEDVLEFLRAHANRPETDILSICTGIILCGEAGIIKGKTVSGTRGLEAQLKPYGAILVGQKYRYWRDGNLWSSGMFCPTP